MMRINDFKMYSKSTFPIFFMITEAPRNVYVSVVYVIAKRILYIFSLGNVWEYGTDVTH